MAGKLRVEYPGAIYHVLSRGGQKLKMARRLRQETTMTLNWIARRLEMGAAGDKNNMRLCGTDPNGA
jgi:hypothetical protein